MISQKFGGSGLRYFLNFHNLSTEKNVPCLHIFFGVQFASAAVEQILGEEFPGKSQIWATEKCTSPGSRLTEQRFSFFTCLTFWPLCEGGWSLSGTRFSFEIVKELNWERKVSNNYPLLTKYLLHTPFLMLCIVLYLYFIRFLFLSFFLHTYNIFPSIRLTSVLPKEIPRNPYQ